MVITCKYGKGVIGSFFFQTLKLKTMSLILVWVVVLQIKYF